MDLSDLLSSLSISSNDNEDIDQLITQIMNYMQEASEAGKDNYTYYFHSNQNIKQIVNWLKYYFPDIGILHFQNYIIIDWS
jgi:hypothetical protein